MKVDPLYTRSCDALWPKLGIVLQQHHVSMPLLGQVSAAEMLLVDRHRARL